MEPLLSILFCLASAADTTPFAAETELSHDITVAELRAHVYRLASPEFGGRRGLGAIRACNHLEGRFRALPLRPAFGEAYIQPIPARGGNPDSLLGRNVAAMLPGRDPAVKDEWILLAAHYDHLGASKDKLFPGADDNASGVAMLLEVAERLALAPKGPRRTVVFASFDREEDGLLGSTYFAAHPPMEFKNLKAVFVADLLGRAMANVMDEYVYVLGSETAPELRRLIEQVEPGPGLKIGRLGADLIGTRSDYGPFRDRRTPFLFFSTGQHPDYHKPTDLPDRIDYAKLRRSSLWISALVDRPANDEKTPTWAESPDPLDLEEAKSVLLIVGRVLEKPDRIVLKEGQREMLKGVRERLSAIVDRGKITAAERSWLVWTTRYLLVAVF